MDEHWTDRLPEGSVLAIGHPANGVTATKAPDGRFLYNDTRTNGFSRRAVDYDDLRKGSVLTVFNPEEYR